MPSTCVISFDHPDAVYYAGNMLRGTVSLSLTKEKTVRGLFVKIYGRAYAYWREYCGIDHNPRRDANGNTVRSSGHYVSYVGNTMASRIRWLEWEFLVSCFVQKIYI